MKFRNITRTCSAALLLTFAAYAQLTLDPTPRREFGQPRLALLTGAPNYVEGREMNSPQSVAVDTSVNPPILYVADTGNNRVLAWRNATTVQGAVQADLILGQADGFTTIAQGPGRPRTTGFNGPTGLAVDSQGNLFVVDSGNNRIMRFNKPFAQADQGRDLIQPSLILGQTSLNTNSPNQGLPLAANSLSFTPSGAPYRGSLAFDKDGNLWVSDAGNNRVLRFPAAAVQGNTNAPNADLVLGAKDLTTSNQATGTQDLPVQRDKAGLLHPDGLAFDPQGRLYVTDDINRVLIYAPPTASGQPALRILGARTRIQGGPELLPVDNQTLGIQTSNGGTVPPTSVFFVAGFPWVVDSGANRLVRFDPFEQFPPETPENFSPRANFVWGQDQLLDYNPNRNQPEPSNRGLFRPTYATVAGNDVYVVDTGNNRVLVIPTINQTLQVSASRVIGQPGFAFNGPNVVDERGLFVFPGLYTISGIGARFTDAGGIVVDNKSNPPRLYISDTYNHRVLGFRDARVVRPGDKADIVFGQIDFNRSVRNYPTGDAARPSATSLAFPNGLAVDADGNLWVADGGNGRVLRFPKPFDVTTGRQTANLVLGQADFTSVISDASAGNMAQPAGVAFTFAGDVLVSDAQHNRVLLFRKPTGADFRNGQIASRVIGQPDFFTVARGSASNRMTSPRGIATDQDDRLYVADTGNNRLLIYNRVPQVGQDPSPSLVVTAGLNSPNSLYISPTTSEIWVADTGNGRVLRFPKFDALTVSLQPDANFSIQGGGTALGVTLDQFGNLLIMESSNRVTFFYPGLAATNGANYRLLLAPGTLATIFPKQGRFTEQTAGLTSLPAPTELADTQVLINDKPVPVLYVSPGQINFLVPYDAPNSGSADFIVLRKSTQQVLASGTITLNDASPAFFTTDSSGRGQIAALNEDNTPNRPGNAVGWGKVIQLFLTGTGPVPGAPSDGSAANGQPTSEKPRVFLNSEFIEDKYVEFSGLAPGFVGLWQVNVRIPNNTLPGDRIDLVLQYKSALSNRSPEDQIIRTTIAVKQ